MYRKTKKTYIMCNIYKPRNDVNAKRQRKMYIHVENVEESCSIKRKNKKKKEKIQCTIEEVIKE